MFVIEAVEADSRSCADRLDALVVEGRRVAAERLQLVAHWADLHPAPARTGMPAHGSDGTPAVAAHAASELGVLLRTSTMTASLLMRDALDLRHRHPRLWRAVMTGRVEEWAARKVARAAAWLTLAQARWVDAETLPALIGLPFARAWEVVEGKVIAADPEGHEERRREAASRRYVSRSRRDNPFGLRTLVAQTTAGDVARMEAMVDHLAGLLLAAGDTEPVGVRRAKAFGMLANPALACVFMAATTDDRADAHAERARRDHAITAEPSEQSDPPKRSEDPGPSEHPGSDRTGGHICPDRACPGKNQHAEPQPEPEPGPTPEPEPEPVTAVHAALELGRLLASGGRRVLDRLRPRTVLYLHIAAEAVQGVATQTAGADATAPDPTAVVRAEGLGPVTVPELREWLAGHLGADQVTVRPVLDWAGQTPVDSYEVPATMRESLHQLHPYEVFPWGTLRSRRGDADHTAPYRDRMSGGPPGQTRIGNLGPLGRSHHNAKTHGGFSHHQPLPGVHLWRTPTGHWYQVDHTGTHALGRATPALVRQRRDRPASPVEHAFTRLLLEVG